MGRYSHSRDDEINPALKLNGSKLVNRIHQVMVGNTRTLSPTVVNEFRFGYNSFYNTFGRELAFVRDVTVGAGHPRHVIASGNRLGHSEHRPQRIERLWRQHRRAVHRPEQKRVRVHRQRVVDQGPALVQGRRARPCRPLQPGRQPVPARRVPVRRPGDRVAERHSGDGRPSRPRLPTSCSATSVSPSCRSSWP